MKKNLLILLFFAFVLNARAGVLIEPYVGLVTSGDYEEEGNSNSGEYNGQTYGARLGWQQLGFFAGLDYRMSSKEVSIGSSDYDVKDTLAAAVVGYEFPILLRVWGEYILTGEADVSKDADSTFKQPSGTILGVGYSGLPFVSLNFEIANYTYSQYEQADGSNADQDFDFSHYLLSVSLPLDL